MNLQNVKIVHDVLIEVMDVSTDIDSAARSLAFSDFCPSTSECGNYFCSCVACWKAWLESEVNVNESSRV